MLGDGGVLGVNGGGGGCRGGCCGKRRRVNESELGGQKDVASSGGQRVAALGQPRCVAAMRR